MPVTFTALGDTLDVTIIDDNFKVIQDLLRAGLVAEDFVAQFHRVNVKKYTQGTLQTMTITARQPLFAKAVKYGAAEVGDVLSSKPNTYNTIDLTFRPEDRMVTQTNTSAYDNISEDESNAFQAMELLGYPGPSFFYDWQEDGLSEPVGAGWPPTGWPFKRYPDEQCFSLWTTVPGASMRMEVPAPCLAKITAGAIVSQNMFRGLARGKWCKDNAVPIVFDTTFGDAINNRHFNFSRFGLFVDTNPVLRSSEFANTNPNIDSDKVSWKKVLDRTFMMPQRASVKLVGTVALAGGCRYNFSLKNRQAGIRGYDRGGNWSADNFESSAHDRTNRTAAWKAKTLTELGMVSGDPTEKLCWFPNFISLWESTSITVELFFGRSQEETDSSSGEMIDMYYVGS